MSTDSDFSTRFLHRHNPEGTFDSICCNCFQTIATESTNVQLLAHEQNHDCAKFAREKEVEDLSKRNSRLTFEYDCPSAQN